MFKGTIKKKGKGGGSMVCAIKRVRKFQLKERKKKALFREVSAQTRASSIKASDTAVNEIMNMEGPMGPTNNSNMTMRVVFRGWVAARSV